MEFRILGPLEVVDDHRELRLGPAKEQSVLAVLLLHANEVVSREQLIDSLWGESPPASAVKAVNVYVSQLRKTLAQNGTDPIATRSPGYLLEIQPERLDAARFERLVADARARAEAGEPEAAVRLFSEALSLWRGQALTGLDLESDARNEVEHLEDLRTSALLDRIDCRLTLGHDEELVGELERVVAQHPLRERPRAQLMLALYRSGRQADALRAYQQARETLVDELGLEPSPALQRLERGILNHDPALETPAGFSRAREDSAPAPSSARQPLPRPPVWPLRLRRRTRIALAVTLVLAGAISAAFALLGNGSHGLASLPPNSIGTIDPSSNEITGRISVPAEPDAIAVGDSLVWFTNGNQQTVTLLDPRTRTIVRTVGVDEIRSGLTVLGGAAWLVEPTPFNDVERISPASATAQQIRIPPPAGLKFVGTGAKPTERAGCYENGVVTSTGGGVWFLCSGDDTLGSVDPATNRLSVASYKGSGVTRGITGVDGRLWIIDGDTVVEFNPTTKAVEQTVTGLSAPAGITSGGGSVWVTNRDSGVVSRIRLAGPGLQATVTTIPVGKGPDAIAYGDDAVWVANTDSRTISRIDPKTSRVTATIKIGSVPVGIAFGAGRVWVTTNSPVTA